MDVGVHVLFCISDLVFLDVYLEVELLDHMPVLIF